VAPRGRLIEPVSAWDPGGAALAFLRHTRAYATSSLANDGQVAFAKDLATASEPSEIERVAKAAGDSPRLGYLLDALHFAKIPQPATVAFIAAAPARDWRGRTVYSKRAQCRRGGSESSWRSELSGGRDSNPRYGVGDNLSGAAGAATQR
jgi:hypothetical protein